MHLPGDRKIIITLIIVFAMTGAFAQTRKKKTTVKKPTVVATNPTPKPEEPTPAPVAPPKKNERPGTASPTTTDGSPENLKSAQRSTNSYRYEFSQPEFVISKIVIEHDESGKGSVKFQKRGEDEITDPIIVSAPALGRINSAYDALNFLDSRDSYQYEKDFSHLGNSTFTLRKGDKERTATFNYTQNKDAKILADEYRKLGNQHVWIFDITVSRENQPLEAPKLLDSLDSLMRRNEISDPEQLVDFLRGLSNDERIPLIARNHAAKLIGQIEKKKK
ncbi:MAG TPA: hypothetical protein VGQ55_04315 [Pyrinomonadaceae bacterium]|nr:hypothetical protein [Pyrinomonadaceae bacterium]